MKLGSIVKFANPVDAEEAVERMVIVDERGDRMLVQSVGGFEDWSIKPQTVYAVSDLVLAESPHVRLSPKGARAAILPDTLKG